MHIPQPPHCDSLAPRRHPHLALNGGRCGGVSAVCDVWGIPSLCDPHVDCHHGMCMSYLSDMLHGLLPYGTCMCCLSGTCTVCDTRVGCYRMCDPNGLL